MPSANNIAQGAVQQAQTNSSDVIAMAPDFSWMGYFQAIGVLCLILALLWSVVWALRKYGKFNFLPKPGAFPREGLCIEAQLPIGPQRNLTVVRFLDKRLLLGVTEHQITLLKEISEQDKEHGSSFSEIMEQEHSQNSDN